MLISRVSEGEGEAEGRDAGDYRTADQLFELMAKDHNYDASDNQSLSTRDLIILYKNIDVGTKLMSSAHVGQHRASNQHVETVVYKDERDSDDSDASEIYSNEDLQNVFSINNERIDLINNLSSAQHPLSHKFGEIGFQTSNFSEYDSHFLFKDPYIKQQLKNINILPDSTEFDTILPATLLDYICCKRLEDNYNFYMDNIIRYVQHTIEQLKRISNGDYLTDRAKEKWREVAKDLVIPSSDSTKVLATSVSIPLHVMGKVDGHRSTWDDIVHSEVDVRSLSKILEKKIVIEVPKLLCGSYRLFSERCADNLIISCKKDLKRDVDQEDEESRVDVVFQLKPSGSGHVISNINSIMILQKLPSITTNEPSADQNADTAFVNCNKSSEERPKIVEIDEQDHKEDNEPVVINSYNDHGFFEANKESESGTSNSSSLNNCLSSIKSNVDKGLLNKKVRIKSLKTETDFTVISPDELRCAIRRLNMQTPVPEESELSETCVSKKKSPTRVRIKSPYENQSYTMEEKKRKKLLEIRDKREKKKMALNECKVTKHKYGKGVVMAQPSSSVTKLSITNKSFYNSIYGENVNQEGGITKKSRKSQRKDISEHESSKCECDNTFYRSSFIALDRNTFDDETTETVMQMRPKSDTETYSIPISAKTNYSTDVNILSQLIGSSGTDYKSDDDTSPVRQTELDQASIHDVNEGVKDSADLGTYQTSCILVPANTPKESPPGNQQDGLRKTTTPVECRKSIDKIYDLLKRIGKHDDIEITTAATQNLNNTEDLNMDGGRSSTIQVSDSGTSVKHHAISSNPSTFSFEKNNNLSRHTYKDKKKKEVPVTVVPKVIISTKLQTSKVDAEWNKTDRKRVITSPSTKVPDNPLKAISQLLHEFNNVQKTRHKTHKKEDHVLVDGKTVSRGGSSKKTKQEPPSKDAGLVHSKTSSYKDRKSRQGQASDVAQFSSQLTYVEDKHAGRLSRRNLSDIIGEAKEARGEAVRGPTKPFSRINTLAQPKKSYVQAHNDECQHKYGKNIIANRLNRVTASAPIVEKNTVMNNPRARRRGSEVPPMTSPKPGISAVPPLDRVMRPRRSASNSPARKRVPPQSPNEPSFRQLAAPKSPDLKKKMVAVESYVKNHYGHMPIDTSELKGHEVHKSRVPLIPNDIELASLSSPIAEESTALGNQLHYMVDTMINTNPPPLSVLTECHESTCKLSDGLAKLSTESLLKIDERKSESDYPVDIFEDKSILTAVASIPKDKIHEVVDENTDSVDTFDVQQFNSATELHKLENALYQRMSVGAFPKRLRIKNLTLTPKQSLKQVIVVQSGDVGSLLVKSSLSQSLRSDSKTDSLTALKPLAALSNTNLNWGFTNIPMQVATIGYAFPTYKSTPNNTLARCVQALIKKPSNEDVSKDVCKYHKTSQCFKGIPTEPCLEQATQANIVVSIASTGNINMGNSKEGEGILTKPLRTGKICGKIRPITTICEKIRVISEKFEKQRQAEPPHMSQPTTEKSKVIHTTNETREIVQQTTQQCEQIPPISEQIEIVQPMPEQQDNAIDIKISKTSLNINTEISEGEPERKSSEIIDHSTSLDILMGLLNEIRKITGETINKNTDNEDEQNSQCKELEIILNNAATHESSIDNCRDVVSVSSFDKLNRLDSNPSMCSFSMKERNEIATNDESKAIIENGKDSPVMCYKSKKVDKEVTVDIDKQYVNKLTDVPSCLIPISHSTNVDDLIIETRRESSALSVYSLAKYETLDYKLSLDNPLEQPKVENKVLSLLDGTRCFNIVDDKKNEKIAKDSDNMNIENIVVVSNRYKRTRKISTRTACVAIASNFDPLLKMKRDILVTVYSILVFTVFAALSFPKIFLQVEM